MNLGKISAMRSSPERQRNLLPRPSNQAVVLFFRHLQIMLEAGIPLHRSLETLRIQESNAAMKAGLQHLLGEVEQGRSLSSAFHSAGDAFDQFPAAFLKVGEESGKLLPTLGLLTHFYERKLRLERRVTSALLYPGLVLALSLILLAILPSQCSKMLMPLFQSVGAELNPLSAFVMKIGLFFGDWRTWLCLGGLCGWLLLLLRSPRQKHRLYRQFSPILLRWKAVRHLMQARLARALAMQLEVGNNILQSLGQAGRLLGHPQIERQISLVAVGVQEGTALGDLLTQIPEIDSQFRQFVVSGEETGSLPRMLRLLAEFYESEFEMEVENSLQWLEPILMTILGGITALFILGLALPLGQVLGKL